MLAEKNENEKGMNEGRLRSVYVAVFGSRNEGGMQME